LCQADEVGTTPVPAASSPTFLASQPGQFRVSKPEMPGFSQMVKPLGGDFKRLFRRENLPLLQVAGVGALTFSPWDRTVQETRWGNGTVHEVLEPGATVGGFVYQTTAAVATYAIGRATGKTRIAELGVDLVRAQIVSQSVTQAVKFTTQRTRPDGTTLSFPSGHTSSAFATASVLRAHFGLKAGIPAYAMAAWVAASRVQMKRHHVSDVIVGASIGLLAGRTVTFGRGSQRFSLSPLVVPGGGGVNLVKIEK
jgi:membrane-associated phospholipid phosphatase